jgi:hypothetical protein
VRALALALLAPLALADERAFVEVVASHASCFAGEPVRLTLRFGFDREFFAKSAVPLFPQAMDVPLQVRAPWLDALEGAAPLGEDDGRGERLRLAVNEAVAGVRIVGDEARGGRTFTVLEVARTYVPAEPGELRVAAPSLRYAHATRFREDFVLGRVALDPVDAAVEGAALAIPVRALPAEGRPAGFAGAVGRFAVRASADRLARPGETFRLTLHVEGGGNLPLLGAPRLDGVRGLHVYGTTEERTAAGRAFTYEVVATGVAEVPPIAFPFFDPSPPPGYRVATTEAIPLAAPRAREASRRIPAAWIAAAVALLALVAAWRPWRRPAPAPDPFAALLAAPGADGFAAFLAAHLRCAPAAVIGPGLAARLEARGVARDLALRAAAALERMVAERYGGGGGGAVDVEALAAELAAAFRALRGPAE